jgi:hypothetical protein
MIVELEDQCGKPWSTRDQFSVADHDCCLRQGHDGHHQCHCGDKL